MTLKELLEKVKEQSLSREQLEEYRDQIVDLFAKMQFELADLEKKEAMFMNLPSLKDLSVAQRKIEFKALSEGQRLIELKRYATATSKLLDSLKSRIYNKI